MADPPTDRGDDTTDDTGAPRWVKVFGIVAVILILVFVVLNLTGLAPSHVPGGRGGHLPRWQH